MDPKSYIYYTLKELDVPMATEYRFDKKRRFRFDYALIHHKIAIEYEGIFSGKSRHTGVVGFTTDTDKYNLATVNGWKVLRYTAKNYKQVYDDVRKLLILK